jgi:hypothetical protein
MHCNLSDRPSTASSVRDRAGDAFTTAIATFLAGATGVLAAAVLTDGGVRQVVAGLRSSGR